MFQELIEMANNITEGNNDDELILEEKALERGKLNLSTYLRSLEMNHYELMVHDMAVPVFTTLFDSETGALTPFGSDFAEDFAIISQDIPSYMAYFSKFAKPPKIGKLSNENVSSFAFYKFLRAIFESPGSLLPTLQDEKPILADFIYKIFSNVKTLFAKITYSDLYREIKSILETVEAEDKQFITDIVEQALADCVVTSYIGRGTKTLSDDVRAYVIKETGATTLMLDELRTKIGHTTNYLMFNTYLQQQANTYQKTWINSFSATKEMFNDAQQTLLILSQKIGEMMGKTPPTGNMHLQITIKWEPKYQNTHISRSAFLELKYMGYITVISLSSNYAEFVLPYFDRPQEIQGRILYISEKHADTPYQMADDTTSKLLHYFSINGITKDQIINEKLKKQGIISSTVGDMIIQMQFKKTDLIPVTQSQLTDDNIDLSVVADYLTTKLVNDWMRTTGRMPLLPPQNLFLAVIDYSIRHAIPATFIYVTILKKLFDGWCESESYLNAFCAFFMVTKNCVDLCSGTEAIKDVFYGIIKELQKRVPLELYSRLKNPTKYEKAALMPLITLTSLLVDNDVKPLFDKLIQEAKANYMKAMFLSLAPVTSSKPTTENAKTLYEYVLKFNPKIETNLANYTFTVSALAESMSIISKRAKLVPQYLESNIIPQCFITVDSDPTVFSTISVYLLKVFLELPIELNERSLFKFVFAYREIWEYLKLGPELSPFKLFFDIVLEWISSISTRLVDWTQRAVDVDTFEVENKADMTSTSLGDLMTMFSQSFNFVQTLKWKNKNIVDIIFTYISTCVCCLKLYTELLMFRIVKYFPKDIIVQTTDNIHVISAMKHADALHNISAASPQQMYVMINDFSQIKPQWEEFLHNIRPLVGASGIPEQFMDPVPYTASIMSAIPNLFASLIQQEVYEYIRERLWVDNSNFKRIFIKKASKKVLHPDFNSRGSAFFNDLFNTCTDFINKRADQLVEHISKDNLDQMLSGFFRGLDAGMMNICLTDEPIKHKRIITIMNFIQDILASLFDQMRDKFNISAKSYVEWAWRSRLTLDYLNANPLELVGKMNIESGQRGLIFYILARSHTNDKYAVDSARNNDPKYIGMRFRANTI